MTLIKIKKVTIGNGTPKVCAPFFGKNTASLIKDIEAAKSKGADIIEWRVDLSKTKDESPVKNLSKFAPHTADIPLIFTSRSVLEGGNGDLNDTDYINLYKDAINSGIVDIVDIELSKGDSCVKELVKYAHSKNIKVILSYHSFKETPTVDFMVKTGEKMLSMGADIPKIATMPNSEIDMLNLLYATAQLKNITTKPLITVSMSEIGLASRLIGGLFGSAVTFAVAKKQSAPGQISISKLKKVMKAIYR